ncbi:hypothetical protein SNOG_09801 [Parastagonospora nodorum SN15]|uniref:Uncharacterized protein n=1 Tax=Phaeosphaeria nodorum (strain SN15 / ATCC MYA-4574 / FGSC 10173) TaxID=321614 RepID=Q0UEL3_PHANO|nr:hypothetical protein SNOG_09801 [Parastagonospora nodorum SN15]EAT83066.1 hypothetical protein SNOG_09801 [Parastagonospora nodorum SN15]
MPSVSLFMLDQKCARNLPPNIVFSSELVSNQEGYTVSYSSIRREILNKRKNKKKKKKGTRVIKCM